jgi:hypothetical protein
MTPELQRYYESRFEMMNSDGWKELIEDIQLIIDSTDKLSSVNTEAELHFKKGELSILKWLVSLEEVSNAAYEELK